MADEAAIRELIAQKRDFVKAQDFFGVLGVPKTAAPSAIQSAYFGLAKRLHPDRLMGAELDEKEAQEARKVFEFATEAFKVLSNNEKRQALLRAQQAGKANPFAQVPMADRMLSEESKIYYHKGKKMLKMRAWPQAEDFLRRAAEQDPENATFLLSLGWAIFNNPDRETDERFEEARQCWSTALEKEPKSSQALYYMSLYYKAKDDARQQRQLLERALDAQPNFVEAQRELRLLDMRAARQGRSGARSSGVAQKGGPSRRPSLIASIFPSLAKRRR